MKQEVLLLFDVLRTEENPCHCAAVKLIELQSVTIQQSGFQLLDPKSCSRLQPEQLQTDVGSHLLHIQSLDQRSHNKEDVFQRRLGPTSADIEDCRAAVYLSQAEAPRPQRRLPHQRKREPQNIYELSPDARSVEIFKRSVSRDKRVCERVEWAAVQNNGGLLCRPTQCSL